MPYRRSYRRGRRPRRSRRVFRRRRFTRRRRGPTRSTGSLTCKQKVLDTSHTIPSGPLPTGLVIKLAFQLEDLEQWGTFSNLFDQYRVNGVKVQLLPVNNTNDATNGGGMFCSSIDLDADSTITTFSAMLQCSNAKTSTWSSAGGLTPYKSIFLKPRIANLINTGTTDAAGNMITSNSLLARGKWIDMADRGKTQMYGLNLGWELNNGNGLVLDQPLTFIYTYYLQFRKVR